jgi:hypothetical protein
MNSKLMNLRNMNFKDIIGLLPVAKPSFMGIRGLSRTWGIVGLVVLGVGALSYPAFRLYKFLAQKKQAGMKTGHSIIKSFTPSYRGKHKPHHRKAEANGGLSEGLS